MEPGREPVAGFARVGYALPIDLARGVAGEPQDRVSIPSPSMSIRRSGLSALAALLLTTPAALASIRHVNAGLATGANDGTSWADAYRGVDALKVAITAAVSGDDLWVAAGTYKPTTTLTRTIYFDLKTNVKIYGGFAGTETLLAERDPAANVTILSGDLAGNDGSNVFTDNSFHVVNGASAASTALLDGFTIEGGNANSSANQDRGGGLLMLSASNATIRNCIVRNNRCSFGGGAGYVNASSPLFEDCRFENNLGGSFGGAFDMASGVGAIFRRCTFSGNSAARAGGVEIFGSSNVQLTNCVFRGNTATGTGGGGAILVLSSSTVTVRDCTIVGNSAPASTGAGLAISGSSGTVANSILYSNTGSGGTQTAANQVQGATVTYSCVQGGFAGTGNISTAPAFVDAANGDYRLLVGSPGIDAGNNASIPAGTTTDRAGAPRLRDDPSTVDTGAGTAPIVDMGAFEYQPPLFQSFCAGDGTLTDHTTDCPCTNDGLLGNGCANSANLAGANLSATGTAAADDVVLSGTGMPANVACIYLQGDGLEDVVFGDGVRCVGGTLVRLRTKQNAGGASSFPEAGVDTITLSARGSVAVGSGEVRRYQTYYRNSSAAFCPPETFNVTNGWQIAW